VEALLGSSLDQDRYKFCYDVGFVLDSIEPSHQEVVGLAVDKQLRSPLVGLNISGLLFMGGYTRNNAFGLRDDYRVLVTSLIDLLISKKGANVLIVPHVFGMQTDSESDSVVCEQVFATLEKKYEGRLGLVRGTYNQSEIKYLIGQCDFFVGSRMHACIAAISQLVPAVCIAYSDKFAGVMATVGVEGLVADARKMDQEAILGIVEKAYDERALLRRQLERKMPKVRETVLSLFAGLSAPIQGAETGGAEGDPGALGGAGARAESGAGVEAAGTIKSDPDQVESPSARADIRSTCDTQTNDGFREGN
jgi:polysaccharide pyruvyl transferase WcaK-like protein